MSFGKRLRLLRENENMTQQKLGEIIGVSARVVGYYESDDRFPKDEDTLIKISQYFDVSTDYLLGITDNPTTYKIMKQDLPNKLKDVGVEYLEVNKYVKKYGLSKDEIEKLLEFALEINNRKN